MKNIHLNIFIILLCFANCRTDSPITPNSNCVTIPDAPIGFGYNFIIDTIKPSYEAPYFNPNNPDEIVLLINDYNKSVFGLYYFNLRINQKKLLYNKRVNFQPKWGRNGWILFCSNDNQIWKVKPNGDSLTQLTFFGANYSPEWNKSSDKFLTSTFINDKYHQIIFDPWGNILDDITNCGGSNSSWQHDSLIAFLSAAWLAYTVPSNCNPFILKDMSKSSNGGTGGVMWMSNYKIVYAINDGLFIYDIIKGTEDKIKITCNSRYYVFLSYSSISNKIIASKVERNLINSNTLYVKSYLVTMNIDGTDEKEIIIP